MQRYSISDLGQQGSSDRTANALLNSNQELLALLCGCYFNKKYKQKGRILRRDTERKKKIRKFRKKVYFQLKRCDWDLLQKMGRELHLFSCPVCNSVLRDPITVDCGHTFCSDCLVSDGNCLVNTCPVCSINLTSQRRCVNVLIRDLVEKWRERNKRTENFEDIVPDSTDIIGVEPRYHLRSGYIGFRINSDTENQVSNYLGDLSPRISEQKKLFWSSNRHTYNSFLDIWLHDLNYEKFRDMLYTVFRGVEDLKEEALRNSWDCISNVDLECILCSRCLLEPVTTDCGHTFCRGCLTRVLDHGLACPLCMSSLVVRDYARPTTDILQEAIKCLFPWDYNERISLCLKESSIMEQSCDIPVFVCINAFPGVVCPLHVYEPRYRLLTRRCLQGPTKRFAMVGHGTNGHKFLSCGTILEVKDAVSLEDGRYFLTTVGVRRYKIISSDEKDGYDTAKVQYVKDCTVSTEKLPELTALHEKVRNKALKWIRLLTPKVLAEAERILGQMPEVEDNWYDLPDGPAWTWWLMPTLPLNSQIQIGFLKSTHLEKRLGALDKMLDHLKTRMAALERHTVVSHVRSIDTCSDEEQNFEMPVATR